MTSAIEPYGYDIVSIPIKSEFYINSRSVIILAKTGNIVTATIRNIKATDQGVKFYYDNSVIPIGFRPASQVSIKLANQNKRNNPGSQEIILIQFLTDGTIGYYNYINSTDEINIFPIDTITYIAKPD